jgi:hypothetical protein
MSEPVHDAVTSDPYDYGSDADPDGKVVAQAFADLDRLTLDLERAVAARKRAEDALQKAKNLETELATRQIPELLEKMRLDKCTTSSGIEVSVKRDIRASLPGHDRGDARSGAILWLIEKGHGGIVKNTVRVDLDRGADERADALVADLRARGFDPQAFKDVHAQTLSALARELMEAGQIIPKDLFNLFDQRTAKIARKD